MEILAVIMRRAWNCHLIKMRIRIWPQNLVAVCRWHIIADHGWQQKISERCQYANLEAVVTCWAIICITVGQIRKENSVAYRNRRRWVLFAMSLNFPMIFRHRSGNMVRFQRQQKNWNFFPCLHMIMGRHFAICSHSLRGMTVRVLQFIPEIFRMQKIYLHFAWLHAETVIKVICL